METVKGILALLKALPEILKLIETIQSRIEKNKLDNKIHEDINKIQKAFETQNEEDLKKIFSS